MIVFSVDVATPLGDMGSSKRSQMAKATLELGNSDDVLIATCCGGRYASERPEIALVLPSDMDEQSGSLLRRVKDALNAQGLEVEVVKRRAVRYHTFNDAQLDNIAQGTKIDNMQEAYRAVDACCAMPNQRLHVGAPSYVAGIHAGQL